MPLVKLTIKHEPVDVDEDEDVGMGEELDGNGKAP